jgi:SAM-dependent methyltransferase
VGHDGAEAAPLAISLLPSGGLRVDMDAEALDRWFASTKRVLEEGYLRHEDPIRQSGFGGGPDRWRSERGPILEAINRDGDLLDVGCANGYLLECLVAWARERDRALVPYGVDFSEKFIELARKRLPAYTAHFWVANAWYWTPPRRFRFVYALLDSVPNDLMGALAGRLLERCVEPGGRLILGHYGSRSRNEPPLDVATILTSAGLRVDGTAQGGDPVVTRFAWTDTP